MKKDDPMWHANTKSVYTKIPVQLKENEFEEFILPHLSMPKRGPKCKIGDWKVFNLPDSLSYLSHIARKIGFPIKGAILNLDGAFDSKDNRKRIFNRGMVPNIPENKRNRMKTKRGRKRLFDEAAHQLRLTVERTFAWEDTYKRLLLRFERKQSCHFTFKLLAYTMINLCQFCHS